MSWSGVGSSVALITASIVYTADLLAVILVTVSCRPAPLFGMPAIGCSHSAMFALTEAWSSSSITAQYDCPLVTVGSVENVKVFFPVELIVSVLVTPPT